MLKKSETGSGYGSFGIVEYDRAGFSASPGVHAWVGEVVLILEPHFMGLSLTPRGKTLAKAFMPKPPEGGLRLNRLQFPKRERLG